MSDTPVLVQHSTTARAEPVFEGQRATVAPENAAVLIMVTQKAPLTVKDTIDQLRFSALQPPTAKLSHRVSQGSLDDWRAGYRAGIEHAISLLKGVVTE
jgi:hypothetical protein